MAKYPDIRLFFSTNAILASKCKMRWFPNEGQNMYMYVELESYKQV